MGAAGIIRFVNGVCRLYFVDSPHHPATAGALCVWRCNERGKIAARKRRVFILAAAMLWGTTGTAQALAPAGVNPLALGALRVAIGGIALLAGDSCGFSGRRNET